MNNFGVIELAGPKTAATPGWAYVPDAAPLHHGPSTGRKRAAARGQGLSLSDQSAREEARVRRELEGLVREGSGRDAIAVPARGRGEFSSVSLPFGFNFPSFCVFQGRLGVPFADWIPRGAAQGKHTPNVRKILQSNKTFANHLDDFEALQGSEGGTPANASTPREPPAKQGAAAATAAARRKASSRASSTTGRSTPRPLAREASAVEGPPVLAPLEKEDVKMEDADADAGDGAEGSAAKGPEVRLPEGAGDVEALLRSRVPDMPSDAELRALLAGPPLSYSQARGALGEEDVRYPVRVFCSICGYWGKVRCVKCGTRVCALECMESHREECVTRYGL